MLASGKLSCLMTSQPHMITKHVLSTVRRYKPCVSLASVESICKYNDLTLNDSSGTNNKRLQNFRAYSTDSTSKRKTLVILGSGWASYAVLKGISKKKYDVIVVTPRNHFLFTPLLASTAVGTLEFRSIIEPVRNLGFRRSDHFHLAHALEADLEKRTLLCQNAVHPDVRYELKYDKIVIGVGALSNTFGVPGVLEHAFFLKEVGDARQIRNRLLSNFEVAQEPGVSHEESCRLLHTVIVGGGPTGVEFGAELYDFVEQDVARLYKQEERKVKVTLIESNQILGAFDERLRNYAEKKIKQRDRFQLLRSSVTEVRKDSVVLANGEVLPCGLVVWSTGLSPRPFISSLKARKNKHGQLLTDQYLQVLDAPVSSAYALGDCGEIDGQKLPCSAQVAERQGRYLARLLNADNEASIGPFSHRNLGMLAYIGGYQALTDTPDVKLKGFTSWFLWRSAYLTRLGSWRLRMQVPMDWLKTLVYGRDTSRF